MRVSNTLDCKFRIANIMKTPIIITLIVALVLAQGLRLCVHAPESTHGEATLASLVHYESDSVEHNLDDGGKDFEVSWIMQGADLPSVLTGLSAFSLLLISLLLVAKPNRRFMVSQSAAVALSDGFRLRPPLRAPPL